MCFCPFATVWLRGRQLNIGEATAPVQPPLRRPCLAISWDKNTWCLVAYQCFRLKLTGIFPKTILVTSVNLHTFWKMGTKLVNTRNMVAFLMALGVKILYDVENVNKTYINFFENAGDSLFLLLIFLCIPSSVNLLFSKFYKSSYWLVNCCISRKTMTTILVLWTGCNISYFIYIWYIECLVSVIAQPFGGSSYTNWVTDVQIDTSWSWNSWFDYQTCSVADSWSRHKTADQTKF